MNTQQLKEFEKTISKNIRSLRAIILSKTRNQPFVLFDIDHIDDIFTEEFYNLPFGYYINKFDFYNEGRVVKIYKNEVDLCLICEGMEGEIYKTTLDDIPIISQLQILHLLIEKEENDLTK